MARIRNWRTPNLTFSAGMLAGPDRLRDLGAPHENHSTEKRAALPIWKPPASFTGAS